MDQGKRDARGTGRRQFLMTMAAAGAALTPTTLWAQVKAGADASAVKALAPSQRALLDRVADLTIPDSDTPGALAVGVPAFVTLALAHGLEGAGAPVPAARFTGGAAPDGATVLDWLTFELDLKTGGAFLSAAPAAQMRALTALDSAAYASGGPPGGDASPWRLLKGLIVTGYYTSEAGASQELQYDLVPGHWDPDVPVGPHARAWSNDWTAVDFG
ncbi:gluconate 2-dehydrogenase subunit 3 family protein [Nitrospirillum amazonense]|uniref:Gluconate 2-dehydrogenase subunit 3-like protein n=1 Tax=Nitrospirillum amazonense TaxID=28077 RepID=A0A560KI08_9PROT|nr:gluconate 2-dehydrogenase subunit 3 family protein [Nitrospirillum amazonense]MDG3441201.1 gluconate 2-dehydrogenase subunit 3 family protein [Nitrospirillum amazonense]TWB80310.1 gluconate 2-dehydrogenase subunit 3-like protein [Nitrospirillum amazonense]